MMITRRTFLALAAASPVFAGRHVATARRYTELIFPSGKSYSDPFHEVTLDLDVTAPDARTQRVPAFWAGEQIWRVRYTAGSPGTYSYRSVCSDTANADLHGVTGTIEVGPYEGSNPLHRHGPPRVSANRRYLEHVDGTPFFWLGDTWWMGLTKRLRWPEDFAWLTTDRVRKGFNVIQIVAGLYPDMDSFDPRGENEAGFPWEKDYARINPAYFDMADLRMVHLVEAGLTPCIVGCWGYYLPVLGMEKMKKHWRYLIARWGALPVVWCLAGEGSMPWYMSADKNKDRDELERGWTEMARYVRQTDPYGRLITIHPSRSSRDVVRDPSVVDIDMLQTGHSDYRSLPNTVRQMVTSHARTPAMPVVNGEVCYEGIMERCREDIQREMFWASILSGGCGFTYGANGIWQVNLPGQPYGPSPHGNAWGNRPWREAAQMPGGRQIGLCAQFLRRLPWQRFEPHPEWVEPHWSEKDYDLPFAAGIPGQLRLMFLPSMFGSAKLVALESGVSWKGTLFNPSTAETHDLGAIQGDAAGEFMLPKFPEVRDWVVLLQKA